MIVQQERKDYVKENSNAGSMTYDIEISRNLLENSRELQIGTIYDQESRTYIDSKGTSIRDIFGQPIDQSTH